MSSYTQYYLGPYLKVKPQIVDVKEETLICSNEDCSRKNNLRTPFCPQCGSKGITKIEIKSTLKSINDIFYDLIDLVNIDKWYTPFDYTEIILPNQGNFNLLYDVAGFFEFSLPTQEEQETQIDRFKLYSDEFSMNLKKIGFNEFEIIYGLIIYTN